MYYYRSRRCHRPCGSRWNGAVTRRLRPCSSSRADQGPGLLVMSGIPGHEPTDPVRASDGPTLRPRTQASATVGPTHRAEARQAAKPGAYPASTAPASRPEAFCFNPGIYQSGVQELRRSRSARASRHPQAGRILLQERHGHRRSDHSGAAHPASAAGVASCSYPCNSRCIFSGNNAVRIALNAGTKWPPTRPVRRDRSDGWAGNEVETSGRTRLLTC